MSLLESLPHRVAIQRRTTVADAYGGSRESWATVSGQSSVEAWVQPAGAAEITMFEKRGQSISHTVYFNADPVIDESCRLIFNGKVLTFRYFQETSAGLEVLWMAFVQEQTQRIVSP